MLLSIAVIIGCTVAIWWCSEQLSHGTRTVGAVYRISPGVRGATLDAVSSSFPELCTVVFALLAGQFDAGVGAIAGSALFNVLVIPAVASLAVGGLVVRRTVVARDGVFYVFVVLAFLVLFALGEPGTGGPGFHRLPRWAGLAGILLYVGYGIVLARQSRAPSDEGNVDAAAELGGPASPGATAWKVGSVRAASVRIAVGMVGVGIACHFLVEHGLRLFRHLGLSPAVAGVTVLAAATSLPDTLLSLFAARRGDADGAIANAFASNSFDILVCLGLPILVLGNLEMSWDSGWPILACLLASSVAAVLFMITDWKLSRTESVIKLTLYVAFCTAVFLGYL